MKRPPWDRALHKFMPHCMILLAATTSSFWVGSVMFALCYARLWMRERNEDEENEKVKAMVDELIKIGERKP